MTNPEGSSGAAVQAAGRLSTQDWLAVAAANGIPLFGVLFLGWSVSLILLLYWLENLVGGLLWARGIKRHERATGMRGHYRNQLGVSANGQPIVGFASEYATGAIVFTAAHGVFLLVFAVIALDAAALVGEQFLWMVGLSVATVLATTVEIRSTQQGLERRSFAWLRAQARMSMWGVMAMHLGVVFGGFALGLKSDSAGILLALLFIGLRTLVDVMRLKARKRAAWERGPTPTPDYRRLPEKTREQMLKKHREQAELEARDEEVCPPGERPGRNRTSAVDPG